MRLFTAVVTSILEDGKKVKQKIRKKEGSWCAWQPQTASEDTDGNTSGGGKWLRVAVASVTPHPSMTGQKIAPLCLKRHIYMVPRHHHRGWLAPASSPFFSSLLLPLHLDSTSAFSAQDKSYWLKLSNDLIVVRRWGTTRGEKRGEELDSPTRIPLNVVCDSSCHFDSLCQFGANAGEVPRLHVYVRVSTSPMVRHGRWAVHGSTNTSLSGSGSGGQERSGMERRKEPASRRECRAALWLKSASPWSPQLLPRKSNGTALRFEIYIYNISLQAAAAPAFFLTKILKSKTTQHHLFKTQRKTFIPQAVHNCGSLPFEPFGTTVCYNCSISAV